MLSDPCWSPAVERQAKDGSHRIGQTKPVFVNKLVAEGAVKAAIGARQAKTWVLADARFEGPATDCSPSPRANSPPRDVRAPLAERGRWDTTTGSRASGRPPVSRPDRLGGGRRAAGSGGDRAGA